MTVSMLKKASTVYDNAGAVHDSNTRNGFYITENYHMEDFRIQKVQTEFYRRWFS